MENQSPRGRKTHKFYAKLRFINKRLDNGRTAAQCTICNALLKNTSISRLCTHRKRCYTSSADLENCAHLVYDVRGNRMVRTHAEFDARVAAEEYMGGNTKIEPMELYMVKSLPQEQDDGEMISGMESNEAEQNLERDPGMEDAFDETVVDGRQENPQAVAADKDHDYSSVPQRHPRAKVRDFDSKATPSTSSYPKFCNSMTTNSLVSIKKAGKMSKLRTNVKVETSMAPENHEETSEDARDEIDMALAKFFLGCNIPPALVESDHFKDFIRIVRPAYTPPCRKTLSTSLMDRVKNDMMVKNRKYASKMTTLLIDGFKRTNNCIDKKNIITMLQAVGGPSMFLESYDLSKTEETEEGLANICEISIELAKTRYGCEVYAVVSDNTSAMTEIGSLTGLWHVTCSSHTAQCLADDFIDHELMTKLSTVLREFSNTELESFLVNLGGSKVVLPSDTRWTTTREACECFLRNLEMMKRVVTESFENSKPELTYVLYDDDFVECVSNTARLLDAVSELINACHGSDISIADATEKWLDFENRIPQDLRTDEVNAAIGRRVQMVTNVYSLSANYLCPVFRGLKLNRIQMNIVHEFLLNFLDSEGLNGLYAFERSIDIFEKLFQKKVISRNVFWGFAEIKYPSLAALAQKLLKIPASSIRWEHMLSN